jgi:uncharacterized protein YceK
MGNERPGRLSSAVALRITREPNQPSADWPARSDRFRSWWLCAQSVCSADLPLLLILATAMLPVPLGLW